MFWHAEEYTTNPMKRKAEENWLFQFFVELALKVASFQRQCCKGNSRRHLMNKGRKCWLCRAGGNWFKCFKSVVSSYKTNHSLQLKPLRWNLSLLWLDESFQWVASAPLARNPDWFNGISAADWHLIAHLCSSPKSVCENKHVRHWN